MLSNQLLVTNPQDINGTKCDIEGEPKMKRVRYGGREENEDRISALPDCLLLHILAFVNTKHVVQTRILSKRWKNLWKHVPTLLFDSSKFKKVASFRKFVSKVLSRHDESTALENLDFRRDGHVEPQILKRIVRYAVSHNVQQLGISIEYGPEFPPIIFSCQSLTSLELSVFPSSTFLVPKSLSLTALTNLHLKNFAFCPSDDDRVEPLSNYKKLHTLVIGGCTLGDAHTLCISNVSVANLSMCIEGTVGKIVLSTPNLRSFALTSFHPQKLVGGNLYIDAFYWSSCAESALILNSWFQMFTNIKSMTLSASTLKVLSSIPDMQNAQYPCFVN